MQGPLAVSPMVTDPEERAQVLKRLTALMRANPLPPTGPRYRAKSFISAVDISVLF